MICADRTCPHCGYLMNLMQFVAVKIKDMRLFPRPGFETGEILK